MEDRVFLRDVVLRGQHGIDALEQAMPQDFSVDIECPTDVRRVALRDDLTDALDYRVLFSIAEGVIGGPPRHLIETLAEEIAQAALARLAIAWVRVRVTKLTPGSIPGRSSVEVRRASTARGGERAHAPVELHVPEFARVKDFYLPLGFRVSREESADPGYLVLTLGRNELAFWPGSPAVAAHSFFGRFPADTPRGVGVEIVIEVDDVWATYERARGVAPAVAAPRLRAWGSRDFRLEDPFGYYLRVTD